MLWFLEENRVDMWSEKNIWHLVALFFDKVYQAVKDRHLPNYFIPEMNLLMNCAEEVMVKVESKLLEIKANLLDHLSCTVTMPEIDKFMLFLDNAKMKLLQVLLAIKRGQLNAQAVTSLELTKFKAKRLLGMRSKVKLYRGRGLCMLYYFLYQDDVENFPLPEPEYTGMAIQDSLFEKMLLFVEDVDRGSPNEVNVSLVSPVEGREFIASNRKDGGKSLQIGHSYPLNVPPVVEEEIHIQENDTIAIHPLSDLDIILQKAIDEVVELDNLGVISHILVPLFLDSVNQKILPYFTGKRQD